jgi:UDP-glucose 4-epimerase
MRVLVTGANGFIGSATCRRLLTDGHDVTGALRRAESFLPERVGRAVVGVLDGKTCWKSALRDVKNVIHLAARVHVLQESTVDSLAAFRLANTETTLNLARQAAASGVRRFVLLSTIKVNGEETVAGRPFTEQDHPSPRDAYAISKWEAEQGLMKLAAETGMEVVIIRPPLVYGPGVKANFLAMMRGLARGLPLPLGAIHNRRSLVALDNLVDLVTICIDHPAAANQVFLVSDGEDLSTTELLRRIATAMGNPAWLLPISQDVLKTGLKLIGKGDVAQRLCSSLQVDINKVITLLGWNPPRSVDEALAKTVRHFLEYSHSSCRGKL